MFLKGAGKGGHSDATEKTSGQSWTVSRLPRCGHGSCLPDPTLPACKPGGRLRPRPRMQGGRRG